MIARLLASAAMVVIVVVGVHWVLNLAFTPLIGALR